MIRIIRAKDTIHKYDLMDLMDISEVTHYRLKAYVLHRYGDKVSFSKSEDTWITKLNKEILR